MPSKPAKPVSKKRLKYFFFSIFEHQFHALRKRIPVSKCKQANAGLRGAPPGQPSVDAGAAIVAVAIKAMLEEVRQDLQLGGLQAPVLGLDVRPRLGVGPHRIQPVHALRNRREDPGHLRVCAHRASSGA